MPDIQKTAFTANIPQNLGSGSPKEQTPTGSFQTVLSDAKPEPVRRPNMAQFMASTGASAQQARDALYVHKDWERYLPNWDNSLDTSSAQKQIAAEVAAGDRAIEEKWSAPLLNGQRSMDSTHIGATAAFQPLRGPMEGAVGGSIDHVFFNSPGTRLHEQLNAFRITRPDGTFATTIMPHNRDYGSTDTSTAFGKAVNPNVTKEMFAADVYAFGLGVDALDEFARQFGAANWNALDWHEVQRTKEAAT